jgi:hypothetical protein
MRNKVLAGLALALAVPSLALAAKPNPPGKSADAHGKAAPKVAYILKGTLSAYTAATSTAPGSITIVVGHSNRHGAALKGQTIVFTVATTTKVVIGQHRTAITDGDKGIVKVRAAKKMSSTDFATFFASHPNASQVIDQKQAPTT